MNTPIHADKAASLADLAVSTSSGAARVCDDASRASATAAPTEQDRPTPGPWMFEPFDRLDDTPGNFHVIRQERTDGGFPEYVATTWGGLHKADARLLAAAPDLLAALRDALNILCNLDEHIPTHQLDEAIADARAAIAKASEAS